MLFFRCHNGWFLALILFLSFTACGGGGGSSTSNTDASLSRIEVTPSQPSLAKGTTLTLTATGIYSDGNTRTLTNDVIWQSTDDSVANLSISGEISALTAGQVSIQAALDNISGSTELTVTNATLSRLELNSTSVQLAKGTRQPLSLIGHYSDGSTQDVTEQATWLLDDTNIASLTSPIVRDNFWLTGLVVGNTQLTASLGALNTQMDVNISAANLLQLIVSPEAAQLPLGGTLSLSAQGLYSDGSSQNLTQQVVWRSADTGILNINDSGHVQPLSIGNTAVSATLSGISTSHTVTVSNAVLTAIEVSSTSDTVPLGNHQPILALGHFSDNSLQDVTDQVVWQSTSTDNVTISNAAGSRGLATAIAMGAVTVTATLGEISGSLNLSASAATLSSIDISPISTRLAVGTQTKFQAIGHYSDGTIQNVTDQTSWATAAANIAVISNAPGNQGQTLALTQGNTLISTTLNGIIGNATLNVTAAQLLSINIVPSELTLPVGARQIMSAEGSFSDGSVQVLGDTVSWESDRPAIAAVDDGELTALQPGSARISASWNGISGNTRITVNNATLNSLLINPSNPSLAIGTEVQFQAIALYSDGSQWDVSTQVTWNSSDINRLHANNSAGHHGQITTLLGGDVTVTASLGGTQANTTVSIGDATLTGLRIIAPNTNLDSAEQQQLTAMGDFSDGSSQDLTAEVIWSSDAPDLAQVGNNDTDRGQVVAGIDVSGAAVITASYAGYNPSLNLTINNTPQRPISLVVIATPNVILNDGVDSSNVEIRVQAASPGATIADGTVIDLQIIQNGIPLSSESLITSSGIASTNITTTDTGLLQIQASIVGTPLQNHTTLYASANLYDAIAGAAFADAQVIGTLVPSGARFGFFLFNLSNRDFPLTGYELRNGADILYSTTDPLALSGNMLNGSAKTGIIITLSGDITDQGIGARYYLTDPATGNPFTFSVTYTSP